MTSKNDLMDKLRELDELLTVLSNNTGSIACSLSALEKARNQPAPDPAELEWLRTANEQLLLQNEELAAAHQRLVKRAHRLSAENARLRELLAVTDQHAGEIVRALAVAEGEN